VNKRFQGFQRFKPFKKFKRLKRFKTSARLPDDWEIYCGSTVANFATVQKAMSPVERHFIEAVKELKKLEKDQLRNTRKTRKIKKEK